MCRFAPPPRTLLDYRDRIYPQFATHNALTVATILEMAGNSEGFEFQRLHGMGESLYRIITQERDIPCRIYAPVGGHRDLLAYLVRRLLENGANSSFVTRVGDPKVPVSELLEHPEDAIEFGHKPYHAAITLPDKLFDPRKNSRGVEFGSRADLDALVEDVAAVNGETFAATCLVDGDDAGQDRQPVVSPVDGKTVVGTVRFADGDLVECAVSAAARAGRYWGVSPVEHRADALERAADLMEEQRGRIVWLLAREAGKTLVDAIAELREAVDFCRYYASQARRHFAKAQAMPGPSGEENLYRLRGRGVFVCISPWNFPLAIFTGQIAAALAAGNAVVAKPAEATNLIAHLTVHLFHEAGIPGDVLQLVLGRGRDIGATLVGHPAVAGVAFTGSTATAQAINRTLAASDGPIVPLIAETGGINAMIADASALPEQLCDDVITSAFRSAGQRCSALRLLCIQEDVADRVIAMISGAAARVGAW